MTDCFEATLFIRHGRALQTLMLDFQAWFCVRDLGRLMGCPLSERSTQKLDPDQRRTVWLFASGEWAKSLMVSESGVFALLVHHYVPENRALRQWLTHDVLPALRDSRQDHQPSMSQLKWLGTSLSLLYWQSEPWIRLKDMPDVLSSTCPSTTTPPNSWWRKMIGTLQVR